MIKQTVVFDFDGVISTYENGWQGEHVINDKPVDGIRDVMIKIKKDYRIVILSTRCSTKEGKEVLSDWLDEYGIPYDELTDVKPKALVYIDDRAIRFNGNANSLYDEIQGFRAWNSKSETNDRYMPQPCDEVQFKLFNDTDLYVGEILYEYEIVNHQNVLCNGLRFYCIRSNSSLHQVPLENIIKRIVR